METHARYTLVGIFTLGVIVATFCFVYWLHTTGGLHHRAVYRIRYDNGVSGLLVGSAVIFNGVRVGEVTALDLDREKPSRVTVDIAVSSDTPIQQDTKAGIDFQGLMGAPVVALTGGVSVLPLEGSPPLLVADPGAGLSMSQAARNTLQVVETTISDNAEPLRNTISNLSKFTEALGRNSDRVDGILAGLQRMTGGSATASTIYDLTSPTSFPEFEKPAKIQLSVRDPSVAFFLAQDKIFVRTKQAVRELSSTVKWSDVLTTLFQARLIQGFENADFLREVTRPIDGVNSEFQLLVDIRSFEIVDEGAPIAEVTFTARVLNQSGQVIEARLFHSAVPASVTDSAAAAAALDTAFKSTSTDLITWTAGVVRAAPQQN